MIYETTTDQWGPDVQRYEANSMEDAVQQLRDDVRAAFGDDAAAEVDESMLVALDAVEVRQDDTGAYEIVGEPESFDDVCDAVREFRHSAPLIGWTPYTRVYAVEDNLGDLRRYFVAE